MEGVVLVVREDTSTSLGLGEEGGDLVGPGVGAESLGHVEDQIDSEDTEYVEAASGFISKDNIVDVNKLKATDLPFNPTVSMPKGLKEGEFRLHMFKEDVHNLAKAHAQKSRYAPNLNRSKKNG